MIDVTLPIDLTSANKLLRMHYQARKRLQTDYLNHLLVAGVKSVERRPKRRQVTITRVLGPRQQRFDRDNLFASVKGLLDALRIKGVIFDDTPGWVDLVVTEDESRRSDGPAVRIQIERFAGETP